MYLVFGVLTTIVGWAVYFAVLWAWKGMFSLPVDDTSSGMYIAGYTVAQVIQWVAAVLFAFFTNRKWVFTEADKSVRASIQLVKFASGRVITWSPRSVTARSAPLTVRGETAVKGSTFSPQRSSSAPTPALAPAAERTSSRPPWRR